MPDAPPGPEQLMDMVRTMTIGGVGTLAILMLVGLGVYVFLCWTSSRQWDGLDQRWRMPRP